MLHRHNVGAHAGLAVPYVTPKALNVIAATTPMMTKKVAFGGRVRQRHVFHVEAGAGSPRCCCCSSRIKVRIATIPGPRGSRRLPSFKMGSQPMRRSYTTSRFSERPTAGSTYVGTGGVAPSTRRQLICTSQPDCKRQDTGDSEDESTIIEDDNVANLPDLDMDEGGFRVVRHRKDRAEGIPVLITAASERADLRQVNPILLYSELEAILGGAPVKSRFTAQGALLLDVETEGQANILLETKNIGGIAISSRVPHSYMKNTCIVRGVPKWYSDEELLTFLRPQGVFHAKRIIRRVHTSSSEWESRRTNSVVLTFAPNSERPEKINLGFTRHELVDYVETPPRCFKCQRFGHIAKYCRGEQRCKRCGGPHDFKTADFNLHGRASTGRWESVLEKAPDASEDARQSWYRHDKMTITGAPRPALQRQTGSSNAHRRVKLNAEGKSRAAQRCPLHAPHRPPSCRRL
ncbi:hypothetical protein HPB49_005359 [Dermacentor silvarum]|uniref:Uncharacterized protein n=1 Tax=Dermacentor silvarum TaxID=543639 RepID=A0ACB8DVJ3_DERSI|nr:hypothetical protein HPB49_005359 [Dermacentor silvarum]